MMKKLFGTDGIRGEFGKWPLTTKVIYNVSKAAGVWLKKKFKAKKRIKVVIGKDTRASCDAIERLLTCGLKRSGIEVMTAGIIPTPGLAFLTQDLDIQLGIMISASHNLASDNGIKFFKHNGFKLLEKEEEEIEKITFSLLDQKKVKEKIDGRNIKLDKIATQSYLEYLKKCVPGLNLEKKRMVIDCANGALSAYAGKIFSDLGAKVFTLHNQPNGRNINLDCGSLHPQHTAKYTKIKKAQIGFSFDGDGDRVIASDEKSRILDGDYIMALVSRHFLKNGRLKSKSVVATSMSNFGLEKFLGKLNVKLIRTDVGDKFVLEEIKKRKANFGGEQSGHIIFFDYATTGDGLLTALQILSIIQKEGKPLSKLVAGFKKYPQILCNVRVREKKEFMKMPSVRKKIEEAQKALRGNGRLVVRYSGTEPLARVMVEGVSKKQVKDIAESITCAIQKEIGC